MHAHECLRRRHRIPTGLRLAGAGRRRHITALLLALALASPAALATDGAGGSAQALLARISNEGGATVLRDLVEQDPELGQVLPGVESGDPSWLAVATGLQPFSDGAISLSLDYAVARALPKDPNRVLGLIGHGFTVADICTSPFIEPDPGVAEAYEQQALAALAKVRAPALVPLAADCATRVRLPVGD